MLDTLKKCLSSFSGEYAEMRFHERKSTYIRIAAGELEDATFLKNAGVGVRALVGGSWGFSSTNILERDAIESSLKDAEKAARVASQNRTEKVEGLADAELAKGTFHPVVNDPVENHSMEEKMNLVIEAEKAAKDASENVKSAVSVYSELIDKKTLASTDGAEFELHDVKPEFYVYAIASENGDRVGAVKTAHQGEAPQGRGRNDHPGTLAGGPDKPRGDRTHGGGGLRAVRLRDQGQARTEARERPGHSRGQREPAGRGARHGQRARG
jgi:TldD protein